MAWALITGASSGLGRQFAYHLAHEGYDLIITARRGDLLDDIAEKIRARYGVHVDTIVADLSRRDDAYRIVAILEDRQDICLVINNAGYTLAQEFSETALDDQIALLEVMVTSVLIITHAAVRSMKIRGEGSILITSSYVANTAMGIYAAHKTWDLVFAETLHAQLTDSHIHVTALCPGTLKTDFWSSTNADLSHPIFALSALDLSFVVKEALKALRRNKAICIPGRRYRALNVVKHIAPRSLVNWATVCLNRRRMHL